jgi:hypothetical protein
MGKKKSELLESLKVNYISKIETSDDGKNLEEILFKTVKYLLRHIYDSSSTTLDSYSEREIKKLFSAFGEIAQTACDFYQASKEHLDPETLNTKTCQNLETATQEVTKVEALMTSIEKNTTEF